MNRLITLLALLCGGIAAALPPAALAQVPPCPGYLPPDSVTAGLWLLNGDLLDASGHLSSGVIGATSPSPAPVFNYAEYASSPSSLFFENAGTEASDGRVEIPNCPVWPTPQALTIEAWIKPVSGSGSNLRREILTRSCEAGHSQFPFGLRLNAQSKLEGWVNNSGTNITLCATDEALPLDVWSYVMMTYDGTTLKLYAASYQRPCITKMCSASGGILNLSGNFVIGAQKNVPNPNPRGPFGHSFKGYIDTVRVTSAVRPGQCPTCTILSVELVTWSTVKRLYN